MALFDAAPCGKLSQHVHSPRADFVSKYSITYKEDREIHHWLRLLVATNVTPKNEPVDIIDEANQLIATWTTIIKKQEPLPRFFTLHHSQLTPANYAVIEIGSSPYPYIFVVNGQVLEYYIWYYQETL